MFGFGIGSLYLACFKSRFFTCGFIGISLYDRFHLWHWLYASENQKKSKCGLVFKQSKQLNLPELHCIPRKPWMIEGGPGKLGLWDRTARRRGPTDGKAESCCGFLGTQEAFLTENDLYFSRLKKYYGLSELTFIITKKSFIFVNYIINKQQLLVEFGRHFSLTLPYNHRFDSFLLAAAIKSVSV
jgi:hypothetical protein